MQIFDDLKFEELKIINNDSISFLQEVKEEIINNIREKYDLDNYFYHLLEFFERIIKWEDEPYKDLISKFLFDKSNNIDLLLNEFNKTLYEQKNE